MIDLKFDSNLNVFKSHFPNSPLVPGGLIIDIIISHLKSQGLVDCITNYEWKSLFRSPILPDLSYKLSINGDSNRINAIISYEGVDCLESSFKRKIVDYSNIIEIPSVIGRLSSASGIQQMDIEFLESWTNLEEFADVGAFGVGEISSKNLSCVDDFSYEGDFGSVFGLMELIGAQVLLSLSSRIKDSGLFGYVRFSKCHILDLNIKGSGNLHVVTSSKLINGNTIVWRSTVYNNKKPVFLASAISRNFLRLDNNEE